MATKRKTGLLDIFGECFDETKPAVIAHFCSKDYVDRVDMWFPILHRGQASFDASYDPEAVFQEMLARRKTQGVSTEGKWRVEFQNPVTRTINVPHYRGVLANAPVPVAGTKSFAEVMDNRVRVWLSDITKMPPPMRPSGLTLWLERL